MSKIYQNSDDQRHKLPPERQLALEYDVSRFTIRKALEKLVSIGVVEIIQGSGIWINSQARNNPLVYNSITEKRFDQMAFCMVNLHKKLPGLEEQQVFGLGADEYIWQFCRLRYVDNKKYKLKFHRCP